MLKKILTIIFFCSLLILLANTPVAWAQEKLEINFFWGQGCPHCEKAKDFLTRMQEKYPEIQVNSYEVFLHPDNQKLFQEFGQKYGVEIRGVPMIFMGEKVHKGYKSDATSGKEIEECIKECLPKTSESDKSRWENLKSEILKNLPEGSVAIEGKEIAKPALTFPKIISLAIADSVNPCVLTVMGLMLVLVLTYNPQRKIKVLWAGLAFNLAIFLTYIFYGLVIIKFFQIVQALSLLRFWLYKGLAVLAIILGIIAIKDFIKNRHQCKVMPRLNKIIARITSPKGAFLVGIFVTLFLLPCTIGPYIVAGGILSSFALLKTIPWLLLYNFIFILPTLAIAIIIYAGITKVQDVSMWETKYMKYLNLVDGILMIALGLLMLFNVL